MRRCYSCDRADVTPCPMCGNGACADHFPTGATEAVRQRYIEVPIWVPPGPHPEVQWHTEPYTVLTWVSGDRAVDHTVPVVAGNVWLTVDEMSAWKRAWKTGTSRCERCRTRDADQAVLALVAKRRAAAEARARHVAAEEKREQEEHDARVAAREALHGGHAELVRRRDELMSKPHGEMPLGWGFNPIGALFGFLASTLLIVPVVNVLVVHPDHDHIFEGSRSWKISTAIAVGAWLIWLTIKVTGRVMERDRARQLAELRKLFGCGNPVCSRCPR